MATEQVPAQEGKLEALRPSALLGGGGRRGGGGGGVLGGHQGWEETSEMKSSKAHLCFVVRAGSGSLNLLRLPVIVVTGSID